LESKASALATPSHLNQSRPNLKVWTPMRLNLMVVRLQPVGTGARPKGLPPPPAEASMPLS